MTAVATADRPRLGERLAAAPWPELAAPAALLLLVVVFGAADSTFLTTGNIEAILQASAILVVLAVAQTFVVATAGIDLSVASTMTLGAVVLGQVYSSGAGIGWAILAGVAAATAVGLVNGAIVAKGGITDFIVTLGTLSAASGLALILADGKPQPVLSKFMLDLSASGIGIISWSVLVAAVVAVTAHVVLFRTRLGVHLLAVGGSTDAARSTGVRNVRVKMSVYLISGLLAGLAAVLLVARVGAAEPASNTSFLLNSVAAVVLGGVSLFGGRATIIGPVVGALLLASLVNGLTLLGVSQFYQPLAVGIVVVLAAFLTRFQK
ncbi:MAG: ribose transport system permease protein [Actinomycetota bacterium]|jgi:ribose transport system permease protein|nr:ribose transport system permease protein [Actinomycetota bacterium]MDQ1663992.1 ribose transport system permease protein [Actinomycetota bacterium]